MTEKIRFFIDTEFIEQGRFAPLDLLSIGIICENNNCLYLENINANWDKASNWVIENVFPNLNSRKITNESGEIKGIIIPELPCDTNGVLIEELESLESYNFRCKYNLFTPEEIANQVSTFIYENSFSKNKKSAFWGYFCDYDWVLFCQLFGTMSELPKGFPFYCNDLKQLMKLVGENKSLDELTLKASNHNALDDARHIKIGFETILSNYPICNQLFI